MRIEILAVARGRDPVIEDLVARYLERTPWKTRLRTIEGGGSASPVRRREIETRRLLEALAGAHAIVLDERGRAMSSEAFARLLARRAEEGCERLAFVIGGADGLDPRVRQRADLLLSLGPMTFPHRLVRLLLAEQIYRAGTILSGHPYHRA